MKDLILLHGALGCTISLSPTIESLSTEFNCHTFNFSGHGKQPFSQEGFGIEYFAEELKEFIKEKELTQPDIFGYSMGGYVALYLAFQHPGLLGKIITLGTKFGWSPQSAAKETSRMNPELMIEKIPAYTTKLENLHGPQWKELIWQTAGMMMELGESPLLNIELLSSLEERVLIMRGSEDQMVNDVESKWAVANLPKGNFKSLQGQVHPIEKVDILLLSEAIVNFLYV